MYEQLVTTVARKYGLDYVAIKSVQKGYRNEIYPVELRDGRTVQITFFKREPGIIERINRTDAVAEFAAKHGLPVRLRADPRIASLTFSNATYGTLQVAVYKYLPGVTIPWEAYTMNHIKLLGKTMSDLHVALSDMPVESLPDVTHESLILLDRMHDYFEREDVIRAMKEKLQISIRIPPFETAIASTQSYPTQPLHMDFVRGNILFRDATVDDMYVLDNLAISGILDFEKTASGSPVYDIARTYAFLLVDSIYKQPEKVYKYFIQSGYHKRGRTAFTFDHEIFEQLTTFYLVHDLYKFLRHNPYEALHKNEHYVRTRHMLASRHVIRYI